jgi:uncharacterized protein (UPF0262 family)
MPDPANATPGGYLIAVDVDAASLAASPSLERERTVAVHDLIAENHFAPARRDGAFRLRLSLHDRKLAFAVSDAEGSPVVRHILSLKPLSRVMRDYFLIRESHLDARHSAAPSRVEAIDMGRRGVHNEGATILMERLAGKIDIDFATARRLFTLICALDWRGDHQA